MNPIISFDDQSWSWTIDNLYSFIYTGNNIPIYYKDFFETDEIRKSIRKISDTLVEQAKEVPLYPRLEDIFRSLACPNPKVVILGQDPYHNADDNDETIPGSAVGLSFSLPPGATHINPSLKSIQNELVSSRFSVNKSSGDLSSWVSQGVLLLNSAFTVRQNSPGKHVKFWYAFTERLLEYLSDRYNLVWILWGSHAQAFESSIKNPERQCLIRTSHPSPLSAHKSCGAYPAFTKSGCFVQANDWLKAHDLGTINWNIK